MNSSTVSTLGNGPRTRPSWTPTAMGESHARRPIPHFPTCSRRARTTSSSSGGRTPITPPPTAPPTPAPILWASGPKVFHLDYHFIFFDRPMEFTDIAHLPLSPQPGPNHPLPQLLHLPHSHLRHHEPNLLPHPLPHHTRPAALARGRKLHLGQSPGGGPRRVRGCGLADVDRDDVPGELLGGAEHDGTGDSVEFRVSSVFPRRGARGCGAVYAQV